LVLEYGTGLGSYVERILLLQTDEKPLSAVSREGSIRVPVHKGSPEGKDSLQLESFMSSRNFHDIKLAKAPNSV